MGLLVGIWKSRDYHQSLPIVFSILSVTVEHDCTQKGEMGGKDLQRGKFVSNHSFFNEKLDEFLRSRLQLAGS